MDITYKDMSEELPTFFVVFFFWYVFKMFFSMFYHSKPPSNQHLVDIFVPSILSKSLVFLGGKGGGRACQKFMKNVKFPEKNVMRPCRACSSGYSPATCALQ